jgi:hypothetical protein
LNEYQIQTQLRAQLEPMTDKQLEETEQSVTTFKHPITGETFHELAAAHLALGVKRNPGDMARVRRIASRFPGLTDALLAHFPDDWGLQWNIPAETLEANRYRKALGEIHPCSRGPRVCNLLYNAERKAARIALVSDEDVNDAEVHLREERIDALASLIALFSLPDRYAASPVETEDDEPEPAGGWIAKRDEEFAAWQRAWRNARMVE